MERQALIPSLCLSLIGPEGTAQSGDRRGSDWILDKILNREGGQALEQSSQGSGYGIRPVGDQEAFEQWSQTWFDFGVFQYGARSWT